MGVSALFYSNHNSSTRTWYVFVSNPGYLVTSFWEGRENILIPHPMNHCGHTQLQLIQDGNQSISIRQPLFYSNHNSSTRTWYVFVSNPGYLVTSFWEGRENILIPHPMNHCGHTQLQLIQDDDQSISIRQPWVVNRGLNLEQRCYIKVPKFLVSFPGL